MVENDPVRVQIFNKFLILEGIRLEITPSPRKNFGNFPRAAGPREISKIFPRARGDFGEFPKKSGIFIKFWFVIPCYFLHINLSVFSKCVGFHCNQSLTRLIVHCIKCVFEMC